MNILILGGTGLIGSALHHSLTKNKHRITINSRFPEKASRLFPEETRVIGSLSEITDEDEIDAVINLAGAQIVGKRWSHARKKEIWESRVALTQDLVMWLSKRTRKPEVLIGGSAIGFYGDTGERNIDESDQAGADFGARLCAAWEAESIKAESLGIRVCLARTGLVLSNRGGMLAQLLLPFRMGLGSKIASGRQWMSWIHIDDQIAILEHMLFEKSLHGAYNLAAPGSVRNMEFTSTLARTLGRPSFLTVPAFFIRLALGEASELLLGGQRVAPKRLLESSYQFIYPSLQGALQDLLQKPG